MIAMSTIRPCSRPGTVCRVSRILWACGCALGLLLGLATAHARAQTEPAVGLPQYVEALARADAMLQQTDAEQSPAARYERARTVLAPFTQVALPSGEVVALRSLLPPLPPADIDAETVDAALARVRAVQTQLEAAAHDDTAARLALLQEIWERPEFSETETWWQRWQRWLRDMLERLLAPLELGADLGGNWGIVGQLVVWGAVVAAALGLVWLLSTWLRGLLGGLVQDGQLRGANRGEDAPLTAQSAQQQAQRLAAAGNYRQAVRQLYLSALLSLEERDLLRHDRSLTNRELLEQLHNRIASNGAAAEDVVSQLVPVETHLQPVIDTFDAVWYGQREPDQQTFERYAQDLDALNRALTRAGHGKAGAA